MSWFSHHLQRLGEKEQHILFIPSTQVDETYDRHPMREHQDYLKIEVAEAYLQNQTELPVIYAHIGFTREGEWVSWPNLVFPHNQTQSWPNNALLVPTLPYAGDEVILSVGMFGLSGDSAKAAHLTTLRTVAGTLQTPKVARLPELSAILDQGLRNLLTCDDAKLKMGLHTICGGYHQQDYPWIHQGYLLLIRQSETLPPVDQFRIAKGKLCLVNRETGQCEPYRKSDFVLLRMCLFQERTDLDELVGIRSFYNESRQALLEDNEAKALYFIKRALHAAYECEDLTRAEKFRVLDGLKRDFRDVRDAIETTGFFKESPSKLAPLSTEDPGFLTPPRPDQAADRKPEVYLPSLDDLFEDLAL
jgi:hypothetical protein